MMSGGAYSVIEARLAMIPFAAPTWLIPWSLRFLPDAVKHPMKRVVIGIPLWTALVTSLMLQISLYRSMAGIRAPFKDEFFQVEWDTQGIIGICILVSSILEVQRKEKERKQSQTNQTNDWKEL